MRGRKGVRERLDEMITLREEGLTYRQIGAKMGVSYERVRQLISPKRPDLCGRFDSSLKKSVVEAAKSGLKSVSAIAEKTNAKPYYIAKIGKELGLGLEGPQAEQTRLRNEHWQRLFDEGKTITEVAKELGWQTQHVWLYVRRYGLNVRFRSVGPWGHKKNIETGGIIPPEGEE